MDGWAQKHIDTKREGKIERRRERERSSEIHSHRHSLFVCIIYKHTNIDKHIENS